MEKEKKGITNVEVRIGLGVTICLFICYFIPQIQKLAACTSVVMCTQEMREATGKAGVTRLLGVACGGIAGIVVILLDSLTGNDSIFFVLCGLGVILNLVLCRAVKMPAIAARVSVITFCLVVFLLEGNARIHYAVSRFIGTLAGAIIALILTVVWQAINPFRSGFDRKAKPGSGDERE